MFSELSLAVRQIAGVCLCLPVLLYGLYLLWQAIVMRNWGQTTGSITDTQTAWEASDGHIAERIRVKYDYAIGGRFFEGSRMTVSDWMFASGVLFVRKWKTKFPVGKQVSVHFDPVRPEHCILVRPSVLIGALMIATALLSMYLLVKLIP